MFFPILHFTEQNKNEQHLHNGCLLLKIWQKTKASQTNKSTGHVWHDLSSILNCSQLLRTMCLCMVFKELEWLSCCFWMIKHQAVDLCGSNYAVPFPVASTSAKISWRSSCCHISVTNNQSSSALTQLVALWSVQSELSSIVRYLWNTIFDK